MKLFQCCTLLLLFAKLKVMAQEDKANNIVSGKKIVHVSSPLRYIYFSFFSSTDFTFLQDLEHSKRSVLTLGVLPNGRFIMIVTGHQTKNKDHNIQETVFFNQSAGTLTGNECFLEDGVLFKSVYPAFASFYRGHSIGILCNNREWCLLYTVFRTTLIGFDLLSSNADKNGCTIEGTWKESEKVIIIATDESLMYFAYAPSNSSDKHSSVGVFKQKFISMDPIKNTNMCTSLFYEHQTTRYLCTIGSTFVFKNESCQKKVFSLPTLSSGFTYQNTIYMIGIENNTVYAFPKNAFNDTQLAIEFVQVKKKHFWRYGKIPPTTTTKMSLSTRSSSVNVNITSTSMKQSSFSSFGSSNQKSTFVTIESVTFSSINTTNMSIISSSSIVSLRNLIEILVLVLVIMLIILTLLLIFITIYFYLCRKKKKKVKKRKKHFVNKASPKAMASLPSKINEKANIGKEGSTYKGIATNSIQPTSPNEVFVTPNTTVYSDFC